ncbi:hypothetical protein [uncultured Flavobacterium sp.]|uniref:DUF6929 family protein n=1 Tax=uncultured Flavobacterium sp. TaxID=165435 RepID=UPI0025D39E4B|nr:hypothetical protein [uncultured Flavobacterium sp.]
MQKFQLELLFHIIGIGSASGLFLSGNSLYIISDNSHILYEYDMENKTLGKVPLADASHEGALENIPKPDKPDYEAMAAKGNDLYLFGSGSTEKRNAIARIDLANNGALPGIDATDLYMIMQEFGQIDAGNFNIEAAVNNGDIWYLFNRGNGPKGKNGIFTLEGDINETSFQIIYNEVKLPKINGAKSGFTDAVKVGEKMWFIAAAEKSNSTYKDGEVAGTLIGRIDIESMEVEYAQTISAKNKFEGITLYKENPASLEFLLCEDTDSDAKESAVYRLVIPL